MVKHVVDDDIENRKNVLHEIIRLKDKQGEDLKGKLNDADFDMLKKLMVEIPVSLVKITKSVKEKRNDINHLGFRLNPASSNTLETDLEKYYNQFMAIIEENMKEAQDDGQTTA